MVNKKDLFKEEFGDILKNLNKKLDEAPISMNNRYFRIGNREFRTDANGRGYEVE